MVYPATLDTLPDPATRTEADGPTLQAKLSAILAPYKAVIEALEAKVGIDASAATTSLDYKVARSLRQVMDEGTPLASQVALNFVGAGVTATVNNGLGTVDVSIPGGGGGAGLPGGWYAPENYGASGTVASDNTPGVQGAVNAVRSNVRGGFVYFDPTKKYKCDGRLDLSYINGLTLQGGAGNTALAGDISNEYSILFTGADETQTVTTNGTTTITAGSAVFTAAHVGTKIAHPSITGGTAYIESVPGLNFGTRSSSTAVVAVSAGGSIGSGSGTATIGTPFINAAGTIGLSIRNLKIHNSNAGFHGDIVAITNAPGYSDASTGLVENCVIGGVSAAVGNARCCISYRAAISQLMRNTTCIYAVDLVIGKTVPTGNVYSNVIQIENCSFLRQQGWAIKNSHEAWYIKACTFEPRQDNAAAAYKDEDGAFGPLTFVGCWFGDTGDIGSGAPPWIQYKGRALTLQGCLVNSPRGTGGVSIVLDSTGGTGGIVGVNLVGNAFFSTTPVVQTVGGGAAIDCFTAIGNVLIGTSPVLLDDSALAISHQVILGNSGIADKLTATQTMLGGITLKANAGALHDGLFDVALPDNTLAGFDTTNHRLYVKEAGVYKYAALT